MARPIRRTGDGEDVRTSLRRVYFAKLAEMRGKGSGYSFFESGLRKLDAGEPLPYVPRRYLQGIVSDLPGGSTFTVHADNTVRPTPTRPHGVLLGLDFKAGDER